MRWSELKQTSKHGCLRRGDENNKKALPIEPLERCASHDVTDPVPRLGEVLLDVRHIGLCGSDLATFTGLNPQLPLPSLFKT